MNLQDLEAALAKAGKENAKALAAQYGPTVLKMTQENVTAWLNYFFLGKYSDAYMLYLKALAPDELLGEWDKEAAKWKAANDANAAALELRNAIAKKFCDAMVAVFLAAVVV